MVLALVLVFFVFIFYLIQNLFPAGIDLRQLIERQDLTSGQATTTTGGLAMENPNAGQWVVLGGAQKAVFSKRAADIAWAPAKKGIRLFDRDAVQTQKASSAMIEFGEEGTLSMGENTLVVIRLNEYDPFLNEDHAVLTLVEGELWGRIRTKKGRPAVYRVQLKNGGTANIHSNDATGTEAEFRITTDKKRETTSITLIKGTAQISSAGKTIDILPNETALVDKNGDPHAARPRPTPVSLRSPKNNQTVFFRDTPPRLKFDWSPSQYADAYKIQIASDSAFKQLVDDVRITEPPYVRADLGAGAYFWRVRPLGSERDGPKSETWTFGLVQDDEPPPLFLEPPKPTATARRYLLKGFTEPNAHVVANGTTVTPDQYGLFSTEVTLGAGATAVIVEASDAADNTTKMTVQVSGKPYE